MLLPDPQDPVFRDLDEFFRGEGVNLVEMGLRSHRGTVSVHIVLQAPGGLGIDDLSRVHRLLVPRLEGLLQTEDLAVELGSPGLERVLKYLRELNFFQGKKLRFYRAGGKDWEDGVLTGYDQGQVAFATTQGTVLVPATEIHKAQLRDL